MLKNDLFLRALRCDNRHSRPPVWIMRQAGRYMPEYRNLRNRYSFLELCHEPELISQVTLLPIHRFGFDAAILFSDILLILEALEAGLRFEEGSGPIIERPVKSGADLANLRSEGLLDKLHFIEQGIQLTLPQLSVPLIGFCGAPFTVASYLIEGKSTRDLKQTKQWMIRDPTTFSSLLQLITQCTIEYLKMQIKAGVHAIQIFDSWAHVLSPLHFERHSFFYVQQILRALASTNVPIIFFCRGSSAFISQTSKLPLAAISIDWSGDLQEIRTQVPKHIALQGNLDPDILYGSKAVVSHAVDDLLDRMKDDSGYIFNLGHGIHPDTPTESVEVLLDRIQRR